MLRLYGPQFKYNAILKARIYCGDCSKLNIAQMKSVFLILIPILLVSTLAIAVLALSLKSRLESGIEAMEEGASAFVVNGSVSLSDESVSKAQNSFARAEDDFMYVRNIVSPFSFVLSSMAWVPKYGDEIAAAPYLIDIVAFGAQAANHTLKGLGPALDAVSGQSAPNGASRGNMSRLIAALSEGEENFARASSALEKVEKSRKILRSYSIDDPRVLKALDSLDKYMPTLKAAVEGTLLTPNLFGYQNPKRYLVLFQNNEELRATGGFIGGAALVTMQAGELSEFMFRDSYDFDSPQPRPSIMPPAPMVKYMLFGDWKLRDSNWWPDFPTSARKAMEFLELDYKQRVDGVIAIDQDVVVELLRHIGPVPVPEFKEIVTRENFLELTEIYAHPPGYKAFDDFVDKRKVVSDDRKAFMDYVGEAIIDKLNSADKELLIKTLPSIMDLITEKHILVHINDPKSAEMLSSAGLDGSVVVNDGDYLMVIDSNVGYSKADKYIERAISYDVSIDARSTPRASTLKLHYKNISKDTPPHCSAEEIDFWTSHDACYKDYIRVYLPKGAVFLDANGLDSSVELYTENDHMVVAGLMILGPGVEREITLRYAPPRSAVVHSSQPTYSLLVQKQPGTDAVPFSLQLTLDGGTAQGQVSQGGTRPTRVDTTLDKDFRYKLALGHSKDGF